MKSRHLFKIILSAALFLESCSAQPQASERIETPHPGKNHVAGHPSIFAGLCGAQADANLITAASHPHANPSDHTNNVDLDPIYHRYGTSQVDHKVDQDGDKMRLPLLVGNSSRKDDLEGNRAIFQ